MALRIHQDTRAPSLTDTLTVDGVAFDLTGSSVKLKMRAVGSSTLKVDAAATIVTPAAGTVRYDWGATDLDTAGDYLAWWEVTLPSAKVQDHPEFLIEVVPHERPSGHLCEVADVRQYLQKPDGDHEQDTIVDALIGRASDLIASYTGREFVAMGSNPATRLFDVNGYAASREIAVGDLADTPSAVVLLDAEGDTIETLTVADEVVALPLVRRAWEPITALRIRPSGPALASSYQLSVTGTWGFPQVPAEVSYACIVTVGIWMRREITAFASTFNVDEARLERPEALPQAVRAMLRPYRRMGVA